MSFLKYLKIALVTATISVLSLAVLYFYGVGRIPAPAWVNNNPPAMNTNPGLLNSVPDTGKETGTTTGDIGGDQGRDRSADANQDNSSGKAAASSSQVVAEKDTAAPGGLVLYDVPFTSQAPFAEWSDMRQEDGCEEAASLMAVTWARGRKLTPAGAKQEILAASDFELNTYGSYADTSASATAERILSGFFGYDNYSVKYDITANDIISALRSGNILIVPMDGQALENPYYTPPGPDRHMLVVKGYDPDTDEFITNDNGTRRGEDLRYGRKLFYNAIRDYPSGDHVPIAGVRKAMIVIRPEA